MKFERNVESIAFAYETDAIDTLVHLKDIIKAYGRVTVKDLMDLVGVAPNPDDDRLGWLNVDDTTINLIEQDKEHMMAASSRTMSPNSTVYRSIW